MKQIFESENISFVEVSERLVADYLAMVNDYEHVNRFIGGSHAVFTEEKEISWVHKKLDAGAPVFSMLEKKTGDFIGNIELMDPTETEAELGIAITAAKQDKGFGTEAVTALVKYGLYGLGIKKIVLKTNPSNLRAIHVYRKCGFIETDRNEDHVFMEITRG